MLASELLALPEDSPRFCVIPVGLAAPVVGPAVAAEATVCWPVEFVDTAETALATPFINALAPCWAGAGSLVLAAEAPAPLAGASPPLDAGARLAGRAAVIGADVAEPPVRATAPPDPSASVPVIDKGERTSARAVASATIERAAARVVGERPPRMSFPRVRPR
ncbi:MAG: hypothetical protein ACRDIY_05980 [Chloroflexota bacterium]